MIASSLGQVNTYDVLWADTIVMSRGTLDLGQGAPRGTAAHAESATGTDRAVGEAAPTTMPEASERGSEDA